MRLHWSSPLLPQVIAFLEQLTLLMREALEGGASALLLMLSVVNNAVAKADANAIRAGGSLFGLLRRYATLLLAEAFVGRKLIMGLALALGCASFFLGLRSITSDA